MKIQNTTKLLVLAKNAKEGIKDPTKTYYSLVVMQDTDAGSLNCSEEIYNSVEENKINTFITEYNQQYDSFRIIGIVPPTANNGAVEKK